MMKTALLCLLLFAVGTFASPNEEHLPKFQEFIKNHRKVYSSLEELKHRFEVFLQNMQLVEELNKQSTGTRYALNQFADMTNEEIRATYLKFTPPQYEKGLLLHTFDEQLARTTAPMDCPSNGDDKCDWRLAGVVTPVKDQGQCGSCWAFSTTGTMESACAMHSGELISLSEQQLVDCSGTYGNYGCNGGLMENAYRYIIKAGGLMTEEGYPYTARDGKCAFNASQTACSISDYVAIPRGNETALTIAIQKVGPIAIAIDASQSSFHFYHSGIYDEPRCSSTRLDHAVLAVGYGTDSSGNDYYIVKNSWGTIWD